MRPTLTCIDRTSIYTACISSNTCRVDLGLSCQGSQCLCDANRQFWNAVQGRCVDFMTYGGIGCSVDGDCISGKALFCNLDPVGNKCDCPMSSVSGMCDCKRVSGEEYFWNGAGCVLAGVYGSSCNSSVNRTCQMFAEPLFCRSGLCSLLISGEICTSDAQCDHYRNLTCINGVCKSNFIRI